MWSDHAVVVMPCSQNILAGWEYENARSVWSQVILEYS